MSNEPKRVLHVLGTTNLGGAESRVMELYRSIDREKIQFDFLIHTEKEGHYTKEILALGGRIYSVPRFKVYNITEYKKALRSFFSEHKEFVAVHGHMTSTASIYLPIARRAGIPVTIAHARSAGVDKGIKGVITKILRKPIADRVDYCFTCSTEAALAVFGQNNVKRGRVITIPNAIDVDRFAFNDNVRNTVRKELGIDNDKFVIGHVGRFGFMKNHKYLIEIFNEVYSKNNNALLVLIGKGELQDEIKSQSEALGLRDKVMFLGTHSDVERYYQAFDYFVFPSIFEGLPGSVAEAQASGLKCLVSDKVTGEVGLTPLVKYRSIEEPAVEWAKVILEDINLTDDRIKDSKQAQEMIRSKGFDVRQQASLMTDFYIKGTNPPGFVTK